jgi:ubiquinone biosynthesis protein
MSTRPDLFAPEVINQLRTLQDKIPPFRFSKIKAVIEEDLGKPIHEVFSELDETPVAAASVAQVHRARLKNGNQEVAVKVLRPGVRRKVERDQAIMLGIARAICIRPKWRQNDPVGHTKHFIEAIHDQTDLRIEAANYRRFHANFKDWRVARVRFPEVIPGHCGERVLTMEFIRGTKIDALPPGDHPEVARAVRSTMF